MAGSHEISKWWDMSFERPDLSEIWQASRQRYYREACQIVERCGHFYVESRDFVRSGVKMYKRITAYIIKVGAGLLKKHWSMSYILYISCFSTFGHRIYANTNPFACCDIRASASIHFSGILMAIYRGFAWPWWLPPRPSYHDHIKAGQY